MRKMGVPTRKAAKRDQMGAANSSWKGGRVLVNYKTPDGYRFLTAESPRGYWMVKQRGHPNANRDRYVFEHVLVALEAAGLDRMPPDSCVHHINFNRHDNRPENLLVCTNDKHREFHGRLEALTRELLTRGIVRFDPEAGYVLDEGS